MTQNNHAFFTVALKLLNNISTVVGGIAAIFAILAIFLPASVWKPVEAMISSVYGANGWVYYEIAEDRKTTNHGNFYLLKETPTAYYDEISLGDKLRVSDAVSFRTDGGTAYPATFVLIKGDCVIVTKTPDRPIEVQNAKSGGWLKVATAPCGLF